jgi:hypothetical protein
MIPFTHPPSVMEGELLGEAEGELLGLPVGSVLGVATGKLEGASVSGAGSSSSFSGGTTHPPQAQHTVLAVGQAPLDSAQSRVPSPSPPAPQLANPRPKLAQYLDLDAYQAQLYIMPLSSTHGEGPVVTSPNTSIQAGGLTVGADLNPSPI